MTQVIETLGMEVRQCEVPEADVSRYRGARHSRQDVYDSLVNSDGENSRYGMTCEPPFTYHDIRLDASELMVGIAPKSHPCGGFLSSPSEATAVQSQSGTD